MSPKVSKSDKPGRESTGWSTVSVDELRQALTIALLLPPPTGAVEGDGPMFAAFAARFGDDKADALLRRVMALLLWMNSDDSVELVWSNGSPLDLPEFHPAVLDAFATMRLPAAGIPTPNRVFREIDSRVRAHELLAR